MRAAGDADWFVVDLQADGTGELTLDALGRCSSRAWTAAAAAAAAAGLLLLLLLSELAARRHKAPKHRHHGPAKLSTATGCVVLCCFLAARREARQPSACRAPSLHQTDRVPCKHSCVSITVDVATQQNANGTVRVPWQGMDDMPESKHWQPAVRRAESERVTTTRRSRG